MKNPTKEKKNWIILVALPLLSLFITFFLIYLLINDIHRITSNEHSSLTYVWVILESLGLLIVPFVFNIKAITKKFNRPNSSFTSKKEEYFDLKIKKKIKLESKYTPSIIRKCQKCRFENPSSTKICFNCGNQLDNF